MDVKTGAAIELEAKAVSETSDVITVSGWASTFDDVDEQNDLVCRGAFEKSLATYGNPLLLWQHRIDDVPIGCVFECSEKPKGLWVRAEMPAMIFRREYLRDSAAGLPGQLIDSTWIEAAIGAAERMKLQPSGKRIGGLDVADGGSDANALAIRHGCRLTFLQRRHDLRADEAGAWAHAVAADHKCDELRYEALGVGAGAAGALRGKTGMEIIAWSPSDKVLYPRQPWDGVDGSRTNGDLFLNLNSQSWWHLRTRFIETFKASQGVEHDPEMVISLDPDLTDLRQLKSELAQVLYKLNVNGKIVVDKAPDGYRSPNLADAIKIAFAPASLGIEIIGVF